MVPGNFGCGSAVLAATTTLAPSFATFRAIALPIPLLAPVINTVRPDNLLKINLFVKNRALEYVTSNKTYPVFIILIFFLKEYNLF